MTISTRGARLLAVTSFAVTLALAPSATAQLDDFSTLATSPSSMKVEHSVQIVANGSTVYAFSGISRRWASLKGVFGVPSYTLANEHAIVQDGPIFYGFSARTGQFSALFPLTGTATLLQNSSPQSWQHVVLDGKDVHMYSGITGQWYSSSYPFPPTVLTSGRLCVILDDGSTVWGLSAYFGNPVPLFKSGASLVDAIGNLGLAASSGEIHGFSAHRNTWASLPVASTPIVTFGFSNQPGFVALQDGATIAFFSGQTGTFTVLPAAPTATIDLHRMCAAVVDGTTAYAYSGLLGAYQTKSFTTPPTVAISHFFAIFSDATAAHAYSAESNSFAAPLAGTFGFQMTQTAALATASGLTTPSDVYSCLTDLWIAAPLVPAAEVRPAGNAIILLGPTGFMYGFSPRFTTWESLLVPYPTQQYQGNSKQGPGMFTAGVGNDLHTFNPRSGKWRSITTAAPIVSAQPNWNASIFEDGVNAYAIGSFNDRWSTIPLQGPGATLRSQIYSANADEGNRVTAYTAFAQLVLSADYPEYWRAVGQGSRLRLDLAGEPGAPTMLLLGLAEASIPTSYGTLLIHPSSLLIFGSPALSGNGLCDMTFTIPMNPLFSGLSIYFQAAVAGPKGLYLTNSAQARIM